MLPHTGHYRNIKDEFFDITVVLFLYDLEKLKI
jgi:hypothetical protein